jgi:hypothetical protein
MPTINALQKKAAAPPSPAQRVCVIALPDTQSEPEDRSIIFDERTPT